MNIKNNIKIEKIDDFGRGIGHVNNKIIFIDNAMIGEIVDVNIIKQTTKYYEGIVINYIKKSNDRVNIKCPYYNTSIFYINIFFIFNNLINRAFC